MPYKLKGNCVIKSDTGEVVKCHLTHGKALAHLAALEINVVEQGKEQTMKTCPECGAKVKVGMKKCPECGADMSAMMQSGKELKPADYLVVDNGVTHLPIAKVSGTPDRGLAGAAWAALFSAGGFRGNKYSGPKKAEAQRKLKALYARMNWPMPSEKELSLDKQASMVRDAWRKQFDPNYNSADGMVKVGADSAGWPREVFEDYVLVEKSDGTLYRYDYTTNADDSDVTFTGKGVQVTPIYVPMLGESKELTRGIKAVTNATGNYLVLWTTNAFRDREGEIFSQKSIEDYVARRDQSGRQDRVWFWHVKGTDFATVVWQGVVGKFLVEVARVDPTEYGNKMYEALQHPEQYPELLPKGWGTSHGYLYRANDKEAGVYAFFEKYETTVLPYHRASNAYAGIKEALTMGKLTPQKREALTALIGAEAVKEILDAPEKATELLDQLGIDSKEVTDGTDKPVTEGAEVEEVETETPEQAEEPETETPEVLADGKAYELELDEALVKEIAAQVDVSAQVKEAFTAAKADLVAELTAALLPAVKELLQKQTTPVAASTKEQTFQEVLSGKLRLKPYSPTQDSGNVVPQAAIKQMEKELGEGEATDNVVARVTQAMIKGQI